MNGKIIGINLSKQWVKSECGITKLLLGFITESIGEGKTLHSLQEELSDRLKKQQDILKDLPK